MTLRPRRPIPTPPPSGDSTSSQLARLTARHDQALAAVDAGLRASGTNRQLADQLLDIRLILQPPLERAS